MIHIPTAMVLAAGLGTRMRPLTRDQPKPLITVGGKALLDHMLDRLGRADVRHAIVNVHYLADQIERHCALRAGKPPQISISDERDELLETGGAIVKARPHLGQGQIFVANTDQIWTERPGAPSALDMMRAVWNDTAMDVLLLLAHRDHQIGYDGAGDFFCDADGRLTRRGDAPSAPYVFAGVYILNMVITMGNSVAPFSANRFFDIAAAQGRLFGVVLDGFWIHVGDPTARVAAEHSLALQAHESI